jgi:hypothetical protein
MKLIWNSTAKKKEREISSLILKSATHRDKQLNYSDVYEKDIIITKTAIKINNHYFVYVSSYYLKIRISFNFFYFIIAFIYVIWSLILLISVDFNNELEKLIK